MLILHKAQYKETSGKYSSVVDHVATRWVKKKLQ